jgi:shikimate kinase
VRPRLGDDPTSSLRDLYRTRKSLYAAVASFVIDVDELTPDDIVARILDETGVTSNGK